MSELAELFDLPAEQWYGRLDLHFASLQQGTRLIHVRHQGPLRVQRPFYPEGSEVCHLYILHPPGGVVGGDILQIQVQLDLGAQVLLTSPASNKFYRSAGSTAVIEQQFELAQDSVLEWLPQDNIFFEGAQVKSNSVFHLGTNSRLCAWEIQTFGRPAAQDYFTHGKVRQSLEVWQQNKPVFIERGRFHAGSAVMHAPWGLNSEPVLGTMVFSNPDRSECSAYVRAAIGADAPIHCTQTEQMFIARYLGGCAWQARTLFEQVWTLLRPKLLNRKSCAPRVWRT